MRYGLRNCALILACGLFAHVVDAQQVSDDTAFDQPKYKLVDMGTLGGPEATLPFSGYILNRRGQATLQVDTATPDPYYPNFSPFIYPLAKTIVQHAAVWDGNKLIDLGSLPGVQNTGVGELNELGHVLAVSENGKIDPQLGIPEVEGLLWRDGSLTHLGTLGGGQTFSVAINNHDQIAGFATNTVPDAFSFFGGTQTRAVLWENGTVKDIGTLGGPDAFGAYINDRGQIAGFSYIDSSPNATTGMPTVHAFLWERGKMTDLPTAGGTFANVSGLNQRGEVIGQAAVAGDAAAHAALWNRGELTDLGTLGGSNSSANWISDRGSVVGGSALAGDEKFHGFFWRSGKLTDVGVVRGDKCSTSWSVNGRDQVVGASGMCGVAVHAFLWENGRILDLNQLIPPHVQLTYAIDINDRGEIICLGRIPDLEEHALHAFLLVPEDGRAIGDAFTTQATLAQHSLRTLDDIRKMLIRRGITRTDE